MEVSQRTFGGFSHPFFCRTDGHDETEQYRWGFDLCSPVCGNIPLQGYYGYQVSLLTWWHDWTIQTSQQNRQVSIFLFGTSACVTPWRKTNKSFPPQKKIYTLSKTRKNQKTTVATLSPSFSHNHGSVEKWGPGRWLACLLLGGHFPLNHDYGRKGRRFATAFLDS